MSAISFAPPESRLDLLLTAAAPRRGLRGRLLVDVSLAVFVTAMLVLMVRMPGQETIPYHFLFLALTLVYGFRVWSVVWTVVVTVLVTSSTGWVMGSHFRDAAIDAPELAEVPLMPMLFLAMVWHARRRVAALRSLELMAEERRTSLERERELLRDTSHAIRTPVTIARGHMELIRPALADPLARDDADVVVRQLNRMSALSGRLLALARLDFGNAVLPQPLDLSEVIKETGRNWAANADRTWVIECGPTGLVEADPEWLGLALDALLENAIHFTRPGERIELSCRRDVDRATVVVADAGCGIAPEDLPHVFERFWHRNPPGSPPGSGLGLPMAREAAAAHGGSLTVTSTPDTGTRFELTLPCIPRS
jgi:signal transduction histidine kinase